VQPAIGQPYKAGGTVVVSGTINLVVKNVVQVFRDRLGNAASYAPGGQVAPGSWVSIFGENLASRQTTATTVPFGGELAGTRVMLGGQPLPLYYVDGPQINARIPYGLNANTQQQLQVMRDQDQSEPVEVTVASTQPAIFTVSQNGLGQGAIFWTTPAGKYVVADGANPVSQGAVVEVYCTGLGPVNPSVEPGAVSPANPAAQVPKGALTATVGGLAAEVQFAGLAPGSVGVYQVNLKVPQDASLKGDVPVVIGVGDQVSQANVTMAVQ